MGCKKLMAEMIGTFWLVLMGCGAAVLAGFGIGAHGIAMAFGLAIVTMGYAVGGTSGGHFNPAVTIGLVAGGRFEGRDAVGYIIAQVIGALLAAWVLMHIADGKAGYDVARVGLGANGFGEHSPAGYSMNAAIFAEVVMTGMLVFIIMSLQDSRSNGFTPLVIGLTVALIHLVTIPVTGTSINPARSTGPALMMGGWAMDQLWVFWVAPVVGGIAGALLHREIVTRCK